MTTVATVFASLLMFAGLVGALLPVMPDTVLILAGAVILVTSDGFTPADLQLMSILAVIALTAEGLGYLAGVLGAKKGGASWKGMVGAVLGALVGLFVLQPFGIFIGPLVGAVLGETFAGRYGQDAIKAGLGALLGVLGGVVLKFAAGVTMVGLAIYSFLTQ